MSFHKETESKFIFTILQVNSLWEYKGRKVLFHVFKVVPYDLLCTAVNFRLRLYSCSYYLLSIRFLYFSYIYFVFHTRLYYGILCVIFVFYL